MSVQSGIDAIMKALLKAVDRKSHATVDVDGLARRLAAPDQESEDAALRLVQERLLKEHKVAAYPDLTSDHANVRLYRVGTLAHSRMLMFTEPSSFDDAELANDVKKIKGEWDWHCCDSSGARPWTSGESDESSRNAA